MFVVDVFFSKYFSQTKKKKKKIVKFYT